MNNKSNKPNFYERFKQAKKEVDITNLSPADIIGLSELGVDQSKLRPSSRGGRPFKFSPEQEILICKLIESGFSLASIAEQFRTTSETVSNIRDRHLSAKNDN